MISGLNVLVVRGKPVFLKPTFPFLIISIIESNTDVRTGIILFVDDLKPRYRPVWSLDQRVGSRRTPLEIMRARLSKIPGVDEIVLLMPAGAATESLASQAAELDIDIETYDSAAVRAKPWPASQERWQLENDTGTDTWLGTPIATTVAKRRWDRLALVPLANLLVDRHGIIESLRLHQREGFDATFSEDRVTGAGWTILEGTLVAGLQASHPDLMTTRGGLAWALRVPLYPFKIGEYHEPRHRPRMPVDLRLVGQRVCRTFAMCGGNSFETPEFDYREWISTSRWEEAYLDAGPLTAFVEPSNVCAGSCLHCPQPKLRRSRGVMALNIFEYISREIGETDGLKWIFSGMGEPLENPDLGRMVKLVKNKHSMLHTSLNIEPPEDFPWESLDQVRISADALDAEHFSTVRPGCSWERIERFLVTEAARKAEAPECRPEMGVSMLKHHENEAMAGLFIRCWKQMCTPAFRRNFFVWPTDSAPQKVQWYQVLGAAEYLGAVEYSGKVRYAPLNRRPCLHALLGIHILQDGTIARCPYDIEGEHGWGTIRNPDRIVQAWQGDAWRRFRREHLDLAWPAGSPCSQCQDWYHRE